MIKDNNKIVQKIIELLYIIVGALLIAVGVNLFLLPNKMTTGGASGIATIFYYLFNLPMGFSTLMINIPLFVISIIKLGKEFTVKTIISTIFLSLFLDSISLEKLADVFNLDLIISCILGGITVGIGLSLTFKAGASSGGSDLLASIIYKFTKVQSVSQILLVIEVVIISAVIFIFKDVNLGLYSIIAICISTKVIDIIFEGIYYTKIATIITDKKDKIINRILNELKRGATVMSAKGAHTNENKYVITCVISRSQVAAIKQIVMEEDLHSIMYFTSANEALGLGFKSLE
jgi:uncharacterized membrane-anchored protein YitT (DUF2179 family)